MQGTPASSHWSATGLVVSDVDEATMMSTLSLLISCVATSEARCAVDDLHRMLFAGDHDAVAECFAHTVGHPFRGLAEGGDGARFRRDHADLDGLGRCARGLKYPWRRDGAGAAHGCEFEKLAPPVI